MTKEKVSPEVPADRQIASVAKGLVQLMRPRQWIKNGFVLAPLIFTGEFSVALSVAKAVAAAFLFCCASSIVYIINDICDIERDRAHPIKSKKRPLAAGTVTVRHAVYLAILLCCVLGTGFMYFPTTGVVIGCYLLLNTAYSLYLKHQPVVDIFTIALGFVLRVYAGAEALGVPVSGWMFVTTLCLALYLAAVKRRQELLLSGKDGRKVLKNYTVPLVDRYAEVSSTGSLLFYSLFVITERPDMVVTIPFVLYGLFRYWYIVEALDGGESPSDVLLGDLQLSLTVLLWLVVCITIIWRSGG
ncbi:MAG: decaprenyl-phosphate phosphoribosyltransferase [Desulfobulbaceae bacterium]|nr:decaprenyl-phosphate phosphoribosyltransferase [Desulfobulbaceae bacterium]